MNNYTPTPAQFRKVADTFAELAKDKDHRLAFQAPMIAKRGCGTIACHAGSYLYAKTKNNEYYKFAMNAWVRNRAVGFIVKETDQVLIKKEPHASIASYVEGATMIARDLGFDSQLELRDWANENAELWGFLNGGEMFEGSGYIAFGFSDQDMVTIQDIADHYYAVADRVEKTNG